MSIVECIRPRKIFLGPLLYSWIKAFGLGIKNPSLKACSRCMGQGRFPQPYVPLSREVEY
jgi:hypothetical protein